jgi:hypothetical protein
MIIFCWAIWASTPVVQGTLNFLPLDFLAFEIKGTYHIQTDYYEARFGLKSYF